MKICVLLELSRRFDDRTARIVTTLAEPGHSVRVVLGPDGGAQRIAQHCHPRVTVTSCARRFDRRGMRTIGRCWAWVLSLAHAFMVEADVVHAIGYRTLRRGQLLTRGKTLLVYDAPDGIDSNRRRRLERRRLGAAAGLIAGSPPLARELAQRRQGGAMPLVLRDTPERDPATPLSTPLREQLSISQGTLFLQSDPCTANADLAIAALRQVPAAHLVVLTPLERVEDVRLASERGHIASRVHVIEQVDERKLASYAREVSAGLCLSSAPPGERLVPPPAAYRFLAGGARVIAADAVGCEHLSEQTPLVRVVPSNDQRALAGAMADAVSAPPEADDPEAWWWTREHAALMEFYGRLPFLSTGVPPKRSLLPAGGVRRVLRGLVGLRRRASGPATPRGVYHFTHGHRLRARHDFAGAVRSFAQAVENNPSVIRYRLSLAGALRDLGRNEEAIEAYRQAIKASEESSPESLMAAIALARLGARSDGEAFRDKLAASRNRTPELHASLAQLEASLGNFDRARVALNAIADSGEVEPEVERIEMMVREQCGDLTAALKVARRLGEDSAISRLEAKVRVYADDFLPVSPVPRDWAGPRSDRRVMHLLETALPFSTSGYSYRTTSVLAAQRRAGLEPTAVTRLGFPVNRGVIGHPPLEIVDGVVHHYLTLPGVRHYSGIPIDQQLERNTEMLARVVERAGPAALHATSPHLNGLLGLSLREGFDIGLVYEARGFPEMTWACRPGGEQSETYELRREAETRCMREADAVITLSEVMKAQIVQRGVPEERVYVVPHMVDVDRFSPRDKDPELVGEYGLEGKIVAGYISSLVEYEGVDVLLRGIAEARRADRRVVGLIVGDGPAMPNLRELAADLGIEGAIRFTGRVPHSATIAHYSLIDIFVAPRQGWEVCRQVTPLKPFEAMAMGRCLLVSDIPALAETTNWGAHGHLFAVGDSDDLAGRIVALARDPDLRAQLGKDARDFVVANHSTTLPSRMILDPINAARYGRPTTSDVAALQAASAPENTAATGARR